MYSKIILPAIVSLLLVILTACGTAQAGHDFDLKVFETHVERGVSTQLQIRAWLGTPTGSGVNPASRMHKFIIVCNRF